jgi:hypothetical protein
MEEKKSEDNATNQHLTKNVLSWNSALLEKLPNLVPEDCELVVYDAMGFQITKKGYFGLAFPLNDDKHINELKDLSNGYLELQNGTVKMGVTKLENLQTILQIPYLKPGSVQIVTSAFT